jgi:hypothetical protein
MVKKIIHKIIGALILPLFERILNQKSHDIKLARQINALFETAKYIDDYMCSINSVDKPIEIHDIALSHRKIDGLFLEFGVFRGHTINYISKKIGNELIFGFDSFEGLPQFWRDGFDKGVFNLDNNLPIVNSNVRLISGWFDQTLKDFKIEKPIAYLHIDCDLYSSTKIIFDYLEPHIVPGTIIVFDEYFNYPGWKHGEFLAFKEFIQAKNLEYDYISYCRNHEQVAVIIK